MIIENIILMMPIGIMGLIIGSFLALVITRYPAILQQQWQNDCREYLGLALETHTTERLSLLTPRSHCPHCKTAIPAYYLIPVLSFIMLRGKCHACRRPIRLLYPCVELLTSIASMMIIFHFGITWTGGAGLLLTYLLIALTGIDLKHQLLPDTMTLSGMWMGLLANSYGLFTSLTDAVWATVAGYLAFWILAWIFLQLRKKNGMGHGDFKMVAMAGAWLGCAGMFNTILIAIVSSLLVTCSAILLKRTTWNQPIPFGPFLAIGIWITLLCGNMFIPYY